MSLAAGRRQAEVCEMPKVGPGVTLRHTRLPVTGLVPSSSPQHSLYRLRSAGSDSSY
jgi:hypothetical protein